MEYTKDENVYAKDEKALLIGKASQFNDKSELIKLRAEALDTGHLKLATWGTKKQLIDILRNNELVHFKGMVSMKIMNKEIYFDDLFRRLLALPPKNEEWIAFNIPKGELLKKGWSGKPEKVEIIVNEDMIILKKVNTERN